MHLAGCDYILLGICLTRAPADTGFAIFGFSEFVQALALLVLVFSSTDFLYQFRVSVAAIPVRRLSYVATLVIGGGTLLTDLWFAERWYSLPWGVPRSTFAGIFGASFLLIALLWIWFAFVRAPIFSRWNAKHFTNTLYVAIVRGSEVQLSVLAPEIARSAEALVRLSRARRHPNQQIISPTVSEFAHDVLVILGNRKLCRHIVSSAPGTAIALMREAARQEKYHLPLGGFARNITTAALLNRDSILFHEDTYGADVLGREQPFSNAMYGNYRLVEGISAGSDSPLDIDWRFSWAMDGDQFEAYCRITLLTFKSYVQTGSYHGHSYVLTRAFDVIEGAGRELYKIDNQPLDPTDRIPAARFAAAVGFVADMIAFLGEQPDLDLGDLRLPTEGPGAHRGNIFDAIAELMFELFFEASAVRSPSETAWWIQYNTFWGRIFSFQRNTPAWKAIRFKFSRLVFDEVKRLETFPNFKSARVLGMCLNLFGLSMPPRDHHRREDVALSRAVIGWTKKHYLELARTHPPVAEHVLSADITFEPDQGRLVKTYAQGLRLEPNRSYLVLD